MNEIENISKPEKYTQEYYLYDAIVNYFNKKHGINIDRYEEYFYSDKIKSSGFKNRFSYNYSIEQNWKFNNFPEYKDPSIIMTQRFYFIHQEWLKHLKNNKDIQIPSLSFYYYLMNNYHIDFDDIISINFEQLKNESKIDWITNVCDMFITEFGENINISFINCGKR